MDTGPIMLLSGILSTLQFQIVSGLFEIRAQPHSGLLYLGDGERPFARRRFRLEILKADLKVNPQLLDPLNLSLDHLWG